MVNNDANVFSPVRHRYSLAVQEIHDKGATILDVGGYESRKWIIESMIGECQYTSLNVGYAWYKNEKLLHEYDGVNIPFATDSFDYVISVDSFEHILLGNRELLLTEMLRVCSKKVIVVVPFGCDNRETDESFLLMMCKKYGMKYVPSLIEHEKYGLPNIDEIKKIVKKYNGIIKYATPRKEYWSIQMAMLWNSIVLGEDSLKINRMMQEFQEKSLADYQTELTEESAYRCVLIFPAN